VRGSRQELDSCIGPSPGSLARSDLSPQAGRGNGACCTGAKLSARDVTIHYWLERSNSAFLAVDGVNLDVREGEFLSIVGPSGCGKSTFLKAVDGLLPISGGSLALNGRAIERPGRDRAMVFQQPNLLPWRTVMGNVVYGLELQRRPMGEARNAARHFIELVGSLVSPTPTHRNCRAGCSSG
jgi:NitT/TauT family transport system ATP-binding protein